MSRIGRFPFVLVWALAVPGLASAQSPWLGVDRPARVAAEWYRPGFDEQGEFKAASSVLFLSTRVRASDAVAVVGELPMALGGFKNDQDASAQLGNPYIGLEVGRAGRPVWFEVGARAPVVGSDANSGVLVGFASDIDRLSAFQPQVVAFSGAVNVGTRAASGLGFRLRAGPELLVSTSKDEGDESETLINYGAQLSHLQGPWELSLHAGGAYVTTESGNFGVRSMHQVGAGVSYAVGSVRPGITVRLPLDHDLTEALDYVIGFSLQVPLR